MNNDSFFSLRARAFLAGYRQKEANKKLLLGQLWQGVKSLVNRMGGSGKYKSTYHELRKPGFLNRPVHEKILDYGANIAPAAVGTGVAAHHLSEGEHPGTALLAGVGSGIVSSRKTWAGLKRPRGHIKTTFRGHRQGLPGLGGGILGPTTTTYTPVVDNKAWRYLKGLAPAVSMMGTPALTSTVSDIDKSMRGTTETFAEGFANLGLSAKQTSDAAVEAIKGKRVRNPETGDMELVGGLEQAVDIVAPALKEKIEEGGVAAALGPGAEKIVERAGKVVGNLDETTQGLAGLATSVAGAMEKINASISKGADFAVAHPKRVMAMGGMYMLAAGGVAGLIVWLREMNKRRTIEEQDKRHARQQKKMMKMVLDAQEEE